MKEPSKNRMRFSLLIAALLIVFGAMLISTFRDTGNFIKLRNTDKLQRAEIEQLRREISELKKQVEGLKSNPAVIEDEARKMGFIHEKEKVIIIP